MITIYELARMADDVYPSGTPGGVGGGWQRASQMDHPSGFFGASYRRNDALVVTFRGTDSLKRGGLKDMINDALMYAMPMRQVPQVKPAEEFTHKCIAGHVGPIYIVGHSLGGALAQIVGGRIKGHTCVSFNAPGVRQLLIERGHMPNASRVTNVAMQHDPIHVIGGHVGKLHVFNQHSYHMIHAHSMTNFISVIRKDHRAFHQPETFL